MNRVIGIVVFIISAIAARALGRKYPIAGLIILAVFIAAILVGYIRKLKESNTLNEGESKDGTGE